MAESVFNRMIEGFDEEYHVIVCNHPLYRQLGLSTMTTGTLYDFIYAMNGNIVKGLDQVNANGTIDTTTEDGSRKQVKIEGLFPNRAAFVQQTDVDDPQAIVAHILGVQDTPEENFKWMGWRPNEEGTGRYETSSLADWSITDDIAGDLDQDDLRLSPNDDAPWCELNTRESKHIVGFGYDDEANDGDGGFDAILAPHKKDHQGKHIYASNLTFSAEPTATDPRVNHPLWRIIDMNVFYANMRNYFPRSTWKTEFPDEFANVFAEADFLTDVKASKSGCIQWSGLVNFNLNYAGGTISCERSEYVDFSLYLFDKAYKRPKGNGAALRRVNIVGHKKDVANGRLYGRSEDGDFESVDQNDEATKTASELELSYNPVLKRWESGTPNLIGMLKTPLGAAKKVPGLANIISADIGVDLDGDPDNHFVPSSGIVIPIRPQNGNRHQFMPNYASNRECRKSNLEDDKKKEEFLVYNFNPLKRFDPGTMVMLTRVDGVWMASDLGSGISIEQEVIVDANVGKWSFNYFMTTYNLLFKDSEGVAYTPSDVEEDFHLKYYYNEDSYGDVHSLNNYKMDFSGGFSTKNSQIKNLHDEYFQITSFDQLDSKLYGIRARKSSLAYRAGSPGEKVGEYLETTTTTGFFGGDQITSAEPIYAADNPADLNAIATTQASIDGAGRAIPFALGEYASRNAAHSATFFGCVFPNGYQDEEKLAFVASNDTLTTVEPAAIDALEMSSPDNFAFSNIGGRQTTFSPGPEEKCGVYRAGNWFHSTTNAKSVNPFREDIQYLEKDAEGNITQQYSAPRSDPRNPVATPVHDDGTPISLEENRWQQFNPANAPSMLHAYNRTLGDFTFAQVPADVLTNASPNGVNGQPQRNIHRCYWMNEGLHQLYTGQPNSPKIFRNLVKPTILDGYWLARKDADGVDVSGKQYTVMDSWLDAKPRAKGLVEYRPLKLEGYCGINQTVSPSRTKRYYRAYKEQVNAQAGAQMLSETSPFSLYAIDRNLLLSYAGRITDEWGYLNIGRKLGSPPFSENAQQEGLLINRATDAVGRDRANGYGLRIAHDVTKPHFSSSRHQGSYWGPDGYSVTQAQKIWGNLAGDPSNALKPFKLEGIGAGACGIIATSCKLTTNENIILTTTQRYGMNPWTELTGNFTGSSLIFGLFGFDTSSGQKIKTHKSWGSSIPGEPYRQPNTMAMVARVYHGWPEEQTIFDARNLAVHHFNPDVQFEGAGAANPGLNGNFFNARHFTLKNFEERDPDAEATDPPVSFTYLAPIPSSTVDFTIPSMFQEYPLWEHDSEADPDDPQNILTPDPVPVGAIAYKDVVSYESGGESVQKILADEDLWIVDDQRVGKLLPFKYKKNEFVLQEDNGNPNDPNRDVIQLDYEFFPIEDNALDGEDGPRKYPRLRRSGGGVGTVTKWTNLNAAKNDNTPEYTPEEPLDWAPNPELHGLLITNVGSGYRVGDTFATTYGSLYRVDGIVWSANPDDEVYYDGTQQPPASTPLGYPWKLKKISRSKSVDSKDGIASTTPLYSGVHAGIQLFTFGGTGQGFRAAWPVCYCQEMEYEDSKPKLLEHPTEGTIPKLSSALDPPHTDAEDDGSQGWVVGTVVTNYDLNDQNKSPDRTYDLFVFMQNDVSFCWQGSDEGFLGNTYNLTECDEQFIRLSIEVN